MQAPGRRGLAGGRRVLLNGAPPPATRNPQPYISIPRPVCVCMGRFSKRKQLTRGSGVPGCPQAQQDCGLGAGGLLPWAEVVGTDWRAVSFTLPDSVGSI